MAAVSSTAPAAAGAELRLTVRCDFPAKRVAVTLAGATTLAQLLDRATELLDLERDVLARYSVRAAGLGSDVLQLVEGGTSAAAPVLAKTLLELELADQFQLLFFAPIDVKPPRKKFGKDGLPIGVKVAGDDAKFAGLTPSNVLPKLRLAKGKTKATLLQYVERTWGDIVKTQRRELLALPKAGLIEILQLDELDCKEPELFALTLEWGKQEAKRLGVTPSGDDLKKIMSDLVPHIRFPLFTATEMALMVTPTRILTSEQELHVYTHIGKVSAKKAPEVKDEKKGGKRVYVRVGSFIANPRQPFGVFRPATARFEDNTGIFYWLGTGEGKVGAPYVNPIETEVLARASTLVGSLNSLLDRNYTSAPVENSYGSDTAPWLEFEFKRFKVRPSAYFFAQEQDHYVRNWRVEGSDDGASWTTIREHVADATLTTTRRWSFFELKTDKFFRRLRLQLTGPSHQGSANWDVTQVEWYGYITPATPPA